MVESKLAFVDVGQKRLANHCILCVPTFLELGLYNYYMALTLKANKDDAEMNFLQQTITLHAV